MDYFWIFGILAFGLAMTGIGLPSRVSNIEHKVKKIDKQLKGDISMPKMFEELVGKVQVNI